MQKYETVFIVDSLLKTEEIEAIISKYQRFISDNGGQIDQIEKWGKKRLQYEIKKRQYGYYVRILFEGPGAMIKQLEREYRLNEAILRYATFKLSKLALKALEKENAFSARTETPEASETVAREEVAKTATEEEPQEAADEPVAEETEEVQEPAKAENSEEPEEQKEETKSE